jgi:methylmalonyl-CoA mutase C-terminal domain/subunit
MIDELRNKQIKILVAKPGLDGHDVGAKVIVRALMEAGFEVVYTGLKKTPQEIVDRALAEQVDVIGMSILSGSHIPICEQLAELLRKHNLQHCLWIVGGNIPRRDHEQLKALGVDAVFAVGTPTQTTVDFIRERMR